MFEYPLSPLFVPYLIVGWICHILFESQWKQRDKMLWTLQIYLQSSRPQDLLMDRLTIHTQGGRTNRLVLRSHVGLYLYGRSSFFSMILPWKVWEHFFYRWSHLFKVFWLKCYNQLIFQHHPYKVLWLQCFLIVLMAALMWSFLIAI